MTLALGPPAPVRLASMGSDQPVIFRGGPLSNFAPSPLTLRGPDGRVRQYATVEHFFQAYKVLDASLHVLVADSPTPREAKRAGRAVPLRADWESIKVAVMLEALRAKFAGEPFKTKLLSTGARPIIEESRHDLEWEDVPLAVELGGGGPVIRVRSRA